MKSGLLSLSRLLTRQHQAMLQSHSGAGGRLSTQLAYVRSKVKLGDSGETRTEKKKWTLKMKSWFYLRFSTQEILATRVSWRKRQICTFRLWAYATVGSWEGKLSVYNHDLLTSSLHTQLFWTHRFLLHECVGQPLFCSLASITVF